MLTIQGDSINQVWLQLLNKLYYQPEHKPEPRGLKTHECTGVTVRVNDLRNNLLYHPGRALNYRFAVAEWLWISFGLEDVATLKQYNSQMERFSDDGVKLAGAYGPRLAPQWTYLVSALSKDYFTRQAVATIWTPNPVSSKDVPCTLSLQLIARDGFLNGIVTMRSSDVYLGLGYDFFTFSQLVNSLAGVLGLKSGYLQFSLGSSHLYEMDFVKAKDILDSSNTCESIRSPRLPFTLLDEQRSLKDVLLEPKKFITHGLQYPWSLYADVLNAGSWEQARLILAGASD